MFKTAFIIILALIVISWYNDPSSLTPWKNAADDIGIITTKVVKESGYQLHKMARPDDGVMDSISNKVEDIKHELK